VRNDGHSCADRLRATEGNLGRKSGAQARVSGKGQLGDTLKNRRLPAV
jgi:hypothetical protein